MTPRWEVLALVLASICGCAVGRTEPGVADAPGPGTLDAPTDGRTVVGLGDGWTFTATGVFYPLVASDGLGNTYAASGFSDTLEIAGQTLAAAGSIDLVVVKLGPDGTPQWVRQYGSPDGDQFCSIDAGPDGLVLTGLTNGVMPIAGAADPCPDDDWSCMRAFVIRLGPDGTPRWARGAVGPWSTFDSVALDDATGDVVTFGAFSGHVDVGTGTIAGPLDRLDALVVSYRGDGEVWWAQPVRAGASSISERGTFSPEHVALSISARAPLSFADGTTFPVTSDASEPLVAALDRATGDVRWGIRGQGHANAGPLDVVGDDIVTAIGPIEPLVMGGITLSPTGEVDAGLVRATADGVAWAVRWGGAEGDQAHVRAVVPLPTGQLLVGAFFRDAITVGDTSLATAGDWDDLIAVVDGSTGAARIVATTAKPSADGMHVMARSGDHILVAGRSSGAGDLWGVHVPQAGDFGYVAQRALVFADGEEP